MTPHTHTHAFKKFTWHNVSSNEEPEIRYLRDVFDFSNAHLTDVANPPLRPKIELGGGYVFIVLLFPLYNRKTGLITATEIDIFANKDTVVTVHKNDVNTIKDIAQKIEHEEPYRKQYDADSALSFVLSLIEQINLSLFPMFNHIAWDIDNIETRLFTDRERELVSEILAVKRNIVTINKTMRTQKNVIREFEESHVPYFGKSAGTDQFAQCIRLSEDIWQQLETHKATIDAIQESNESFITFRLNDIMKTLTIFSVIVFPLTLLAAIFGMNATGGMPFLGSAGGFWKVIMLMALGTVLMFYMFKRHKWI